MNLLDRLKPEYLEKLEIVKEQFPTSAEKIQLSLSENQSVFALTIEEASRISTFFDIEMTLSNISTFFDIEMTLSNILELIKDDE